MRARKKKKLNALSYIKTSMAQGSKANNLNHHGKL